MTVPFTSVKDMIGLSNQINMAAKFQINFITGISFTYLPYVKLSGDATSQLKFKRHITW